MAFSIQYEYSTYTRWVVRFLCRYIKWLSAQKLNRPSRKLYLKLNHSSRNFLDELLRVCAGTFYTNNFVWVQLRWPNLVKTTFSFYSAYLQHIPVFHDSAWMAMHQMLSAIQRLPKVLSIVLFVFLVFVAASSQSNIQKCTSKSTGRYTQDNYIQDNYNTTILLCTITDLTTIHVILLHCTTQ